MVAVTIWVFGDFDCESISCPQRHGRRQSFELGVATWLMLWVLLFLYVLFGPFWVNVLSDNVSLKMLFLRRSDSESPVAVVLYGVLVPVPHRLSSPNSVHPLPFYLSTTRRFDGEYISTLLAAPAPAPTTTTMTKEDVGSGLLAVDDRESVFCPLLLSLSVDALNLL